MIEQQLDTLIATMARCELLLARIAEQRMTFTYPPPMQGTVPQNAQGYLLQQANQRRPLGT
jgi:hypothetical protein